MRYTTEYEPFSGVWLIIMDKGYPSESIYNEYGTHWESKIVCNKLNEEEQDD